MRRPRIVAAGGLFALALGCAAVFLPAATATASRVIRVAIDINGQNRIAFDPPAINARAGDVLHICNKTPVNAFLFSVSPHNKFGFESAKSSLKIRPGSCANVTVHNPTGGPIYDRIYDHAHSNPKLLIAVYPKGATIPTTPPTGGRPPPPQRTFNLVPGLTTVSNPNSVELTITPTATGQGIDDHTGKNGGAGNGGDWKVEYHWAVPTTLVPGKTAAIFLQVVVDEVQPQQPLGFQMSALAPDFAQALPCHYPEQSSCSKTFQYAIAADQAGMNEIGVSVHMLSAEVHFTYRPAGK